LQEGQLQAPPTHLVDWRATSMDSGGLCVMTFLLPLMQV